MIPGERRLLYQIVPKQQPTAPGRISVKSCWKSIGKPPHKIPLQLLIWAKTCCLYFGPLSSRIFDCHWQETSSLSLHLNFTNINVTPSTLRKIICDQPHTHLNILGGSSRQIIKHFGDIRTKGHMTTPGTHSEVISFHTVRASKPGE